MDIIKCKDCKYFNTNVPRPMCNHTNGINFPDPEDYCSRAEEKLPNLMPCPFCGSKYVRLDTQSDSTYFCHCDDCGDRTAGYFDKKAAIEAWNRRAEDHGEKIDLGTNWRIQFIPRTDYETFLTEDSISGALKEKKIINGYNYPVVMRFWDKKDYTVKYAMEFNRDNLLNLIMMLKSVVRKIEKGED